MADEHTKKSSVIRRLRRNQGSKKNGEQAETVTELLKVAYVENTGVDDGVSTTVGNDDVANTVGGNEGTNQNDYQHDEAALSITVRVRVEKRICPKSLLATYSTDEMSSPLARMKKG